MNGDILVGIELEHCPFCGDTDVVVKGYPINVTYHGQRQYFVICQHCGCQTKRLYGDVNKVVELWNRRIKNEKKK